jgi:anti-sigma-K factor RskA
MPRRAWGDCLNLLHPERLERLSREYVLGTLGGPARRRFERLLVEAPLATRVVARWQQRFDVLAAGVPPVEPRERVWLGLQQQLFAAREAPAAGVWSRLAALFAPRVLGGALAGVLAATVVLQLEPQWLGMESRSDALPQSYVGLLVNDAGQPTLLASSRRHGRAITVKLLQPLAVPQGQVARLWALPREGQPFLVGMVPARGSATIALVDSAEKLFFNVGRLALTIEPVADGATAPSGPFVASGHCVKLW